MKRVSVGSSASLSGYTLSEEAHHRQVAFLHGLFIDHYRQFSKK